MTRPVHRLGDLSEDDGEITEVIQTTVFANNLPVSVDGSIIEDDDDDLTANGCLTVYIEGIPVNRQGDEDELGSVRAEGSPNVFVGDTNVGGGSAPGAVGAVAGQGGGAGAGNNGDASVTPSTPVVGPPNISQETLAAASVALGRAVTSAALDSGVAGRYSSLPFVSSATTVAAIPATAAFTVSTAANFNFTEQDAKNLHANYLDRILNAPAMKEKYPPWPRLPFGVDNA